MSATDLESPANLMLTGEECLEAGLLSEAIAYFTAAALSGEWEAWLRLSQILERKLTHPHSSISLLFRDKYRSSTELAAASGDNRAAHCLVGLYEFGQPGLIPDPPRALTVLTSLAEAGDSSAQFELFEKYLYGLCSAPIDKSIALRWLTMSAENGHEEAEKWLKGLDTWDKQDFEYPRPTRQ